jgi:hypothetical protein
MHRVEVYLEGVEYATDVWAATDRVLAPMEKLARRKGVLVARFEALLERCAKVGFDRLPVNVIKHYEDGVYGIGERKGPLLRALGFYASGQARQTFVLMDFYEKHGQHNRPIDDERICEVVRIRRSHDWVKG